MLFITQFKKTNKGHKILTTKLKKGTIICQSDNHRDATLILRQSDSHSVATFIKAFMFLHRSYVLKNFDNRVFTVD